MYVQKKLVFSNKLAYQCEVFSLALDGSTNIKDTNQMAVMIRGVTDEFDMLKKS